MFENLDGRTDDGRTTDAGVTGILIAHLGAFGSGELTTVNIRKCRNTTVKGVAVTKYQFIAPDMLKTD